MNDVGARQSCADAQRARAAFQRAIIDLVLEHGYPQTSVEMICRHAGLGSEDFDSLYASKEACYLDAYEKETGLFLEAAAGAFADHDNWRDGLRATAYAAARWVRDHPREIRFGTLEILGAGELAQAYRVKTLLHFVDLLDAGRAELDDPDSLTRSTAEATAGAVSELLVRRLQEGDPALDAVELVPELMYLAVRPYLGEAAAREELTIPAPPETQSDLGEWA